MVCTSVDHRDQRLRTSIYIESAKGKQFLIDTTPDLRTQLLTNKITSLDFVILTHDHADHLHGIDDLRPLTFLPFKKSIPVYCEESVKANLEVRFEYIFGQHAQTRPSIGGGIPRLTLHTVGTMKETIIDGENFTFFNYPHGHHTTMGFVHEKMAYLVDCGEVPADVVRFLKSRKLDLLVIDCLQRHDHLTHLTVKQSFQAIKDIAPKSAGLTHMGHDLSHQHLDALAQREFPANQNISVFPLFDQLKLSYSNA